MKRKHCNKREFNICCMQNHDTHTSKKHGYADQNGWKTQRNRMMRVQSRPIKINREWDENFVDEDTNEIITLHRYDWEYV